MVEKVPKTSRPIDSAAVEVLVTSDEKTYNFLIAGVPYKLKTSHDDATVEELVEFVNSRMNQALGVTKNGSYQNAAVLTAMNLAEELILLKRKAHRELEKLEEKALQLSMDLENSKNNGRF
ncbi:cell division protein ZapA [Bdellovibrio bacteriovorus]|uniref:cell division protein ZapA n=1 Tax=Bdellovibrio bacteriovorus TaxID=959 RepID=UPI0035A67BA3